MKPMRVLVLGGTGHIGAAIARGFAMQGHTVSATGRSTRTRPNLEDTQIKVRVGDDTDAQTIKDWIKDQDLVIDAATPYPLWLHDTNRNQTIALACARTRQILAAVSDNNAAIIHISSFTTLPRQSGLIAQIGQGMMNGAHPYFELKAAVETEVTTALTAGLPGCVINPATCFGPYDLKQRSQTFIPMLLSGEMKGLADHDLNLVDVRDVAAIALAASSFGYPDRQIPVFGHNVRLAALADQICALRGLTSPKFKVPSALGVMGLYWTETAFAVAGRQTPWPSLSAMLLQASYAAAPSAAQIRLHSQMRPIGETLEDAIAWYEHIGHLAV